MVWQDVHSDIFLTSSCASCNSCCGLIWSVHWPVAMLLRLTLRSHYLIYAHHCVPPGAVNPTPSSYHVIREVLSATIRTRKNHESSVNLKWRKSRDSEMSTEEPRQFVSNVLSTFPTEPHKLINEIQRVKFFCDFWKSWIGSHSIPRNKVFVCCTNGDRHTSTRPTTTRGVLCACRSTTGCTTKTGFLHGYTTGYQHGQLWERPPDTNWF